MENELLAAFGERVRMRRKALLWSQEDLAARAHIDRSYIGGVERGERNPTLTMLGKIALALETDLGSLTQGMPRQPQ